MSSKWKYSVEYRSREKKKCVYCGKRGRDVKERPAVKSLKHEACNNCTRQYFS